MKWIAMILAGVLLVFAGAGSAKAADAYEIVLVPPSTSAASIGLFRIAVATGQVVTAWGNSTTYSAIPDSNTLPAGEYHLHVGETLDRQGGYSIYRIDVASGRVWFLVGGGGTPFSWTEIAAAPQ
jgi:hypothetical protein